MEQMLLNSFETALEQGFVHSELHDYRAAGPRGRPGGGGAAPVRRNKLCTKP